MAVVPHTPGVLERLGDTLKFLWKRFHLFTFDKPQAPGIESRWTRNLVPVGATQVLSGELVELLSSIDSRQSVSGASGIRFDILEEDFFLTGGFDDLVVSLVGPNAAEPQDGFQRVSRTTVFHQLTGAETLADHVTAFKASHPHYDSFILIVAEPAAPSAKTHVMTWWRAQRVADFADAEMYFLINIDGTIEDGTEQILDVSPNPSGALTLNGTVVNPAAKGVAGAVVVARSPAGAALGSARTDANGEYRLDLAFTATLTLEVTSGFAKATSAVAAPEANRLTPLTVPAIQVTGLSLKGTVRWPSWIEPTAATAAADRGQITGVSNHFTYTPPPAEAFAPTVYDYDAAYAGMAYGGMELVVIKDADPGVDRQDWPQFRLSIDAGDSRIELAPATVATAAATRGAFVFDNSLAQGDYLIGARSGYRLVIAVGADRSNRFSPRADNLAAFRRLHITAAGDATIDGHPWDGQLVMLPVVEVVETASTTVPGRLTGNLQLPSTTVLTALIDGGRVVDMSRLNGQFDAGAQEALLKHTAITQEDGRTTFLFDHALTGYLDATATERVRLPWIPLTDGLLLDVHQRRRDEMTSADFGRYPLKFIPAAATGPLTARETSRDVGDDVRELKIRLLLWGSATESVDPNVAEFDDVTERAVVRFKQGCHNAVTATDKVKATLSYIGSNPDSAQKLYPNSKMGSVFTGICDFDALRALGRFISDIPHPDLAFDVYRSPAPVVGPLDFGRRGIDRMLIYALESLRRRDGADDFSVQIGVRSWPSHTLDEATRDLSVNHPEGYAVKIRPKPLPAAGADRIAAIDRLRGACVRFGGARGKAGPPGIANDLLPPLPVGLTHSLQPGKLLIAPRSWMDQDDGPGELGVNHRAPVPNPPSTPWRVAQDGVHVGPTVPANHTPRWDPPYVPPSAVKPEEAVGLPTSGQAAALGAGWQANRDAIERWARYYGVPAEVVLAMTATESRHFSGLSARVEPLDKPRVEHVRDLRWAALGCGPFPGGAAHAPSAPPAGAAACAAYTQWFADHNAVLADVNVAHGGLIPASPAGDALVNAITNVVEAVAPLCISGGIIQTLTSTARDALRPEFGAQTDAIVTVHWLLDTYDPDGRSNSIRAGAAYLRQLVDTRQTHMDPPLISGGYNNGAVAASGDPTNRWRLAQFDTAGGHTNRFVAWLNDATAEMLADLPRVNDNLHYYDDLHLDTFMLHHNAWELQFVIGDDHGAGNDPGATARTAPAGPHASALARAYTRTNPQLPPGGPAPPTVAQQATALDNLTRYVTQQLESYEDTTGTPASRVWMRLLWTFAADGVSARSVRWSDSLRVQGVVTSSDGSGPLAAAKVEVTGADPVTTGPSGRYVVAAQPTPAAALPDTVDLRVRVGPFLSVAQPVATVYPGASLSADVSILPIRPRGALAPAQGPAAGGTVVQIDGAGFVPANTTVAIAGVACTAVNAAADRVTATTPAGAAGARDVTITTPAGVCTLVGGFTYT